MTDINYIPAEEALKIVKPGDRVYIHGGAATPVWLVEALQNRHHELYDVELVSITTLGKVNFDRPEHRKSFFVNSLFVSKATRSVANSDDGDYVPIFLSQIPLLFRREILPLDVALIQVSPPDAHGFCSLGTSVDIARAAVDTAKYVIAQVNPLMPRTHGQGFVHMSKINAMVWHKDELPEVNYGNDVTPVIEKIGYNVASLVEDGATIGYWQHTRPGA